jgi:hypothetical protein
MSKYVPQPPPPRHPRHHRRRHHEKPYPHQYLRLDDLQGGQYGFLVLNADSDDALDVQLGGDFVRLTRQQAALLGNAVTTFLAEEEEEAPSSARPPPSGLPSDRSRPQVMVEDAVEAGVEAVEGIAEELMTTERSPSSPPLPIMPRRRGRGRSS